jgi:hypothetical protein
MPKHPGLNLRCLFAFICLFLAGLGLPGQSTSGLTYGGFTNDQGVSICTMADGGYAVVGRTRSFGKGSTDVYVLRLDAHGRTLWSQTFGIELQEHGFWVEPTADQGLLVTGYSYLFLGGGGRQDVFVILLDSNGELVWRKAYGGGLLDVGLCGKPIPGGYGILGISRDGDTYGNFIFMKLGPDGTRLWQQLYDYPFVDYGHEFQRMDNGDYLLFGSESGFLFPSELDHNKPHADMMLLRVDSLGNEIWRKLYGGKRHEMGKAIRPAPGGGWYLFGSTQSEGAGSFDMYLVKVNDDGDQLWSRTYGGSNWDYGTSMDVDADGNLYLLGTTTTLGGTDSPDAYLLKTDPSGEPIWSLSIGGDSSDYGQCVRAHPQGGCVITGDTRSIGHGGQDLLLAMVSADGVPVPLLGAEREDFSGIVYPNPVTVTSTLTSVDGEALVGGELRIYDLSGRLLQTKVLTSGESPTIEREGLTGGTYLYEWVRPSKMRLKGKFVAY